MTAEVLTRETPFLEGYDRLRETLARLGPEWVEGLRAANRERFARLGLPAADDEAWRFTSLKPLHKTRFPAVSETGVRSAALPDLVSGDTSCARLVFVNGVFAPDLSRSGKESCPEALTLDRALRDRREMIENRLAGLADTTRHRFAALNTAFLREGAVVRIPAGTWAGVVQLAFLSVTGSAPRATYPRVLVILEDGAEAVLVEEYLGSEDGPEVGSATFAAPVTEVYLGRNAGLQHLRLVRESALGIHLGLLAVRQDRDSRYTSHAFALGGRLLRLDLDLALAGDGAEATLNGLYLCRGKEHVDHHTRVDHVAPHTRSRELYKGVLSGKSSAVFNGRVVIRPHAQKVDAGQVNRNLLLSDTALVNTNPELEILADDVKAQHGATVGQIEDDHLFYLRSRGIPEDESRRLLIDAFVGEMIDRVSPASVQERLRAELTRRSESSPEPWDGAGLPG
jgi:Fe-S cluster assembly protein SufD